MLTRACFFAVVLAGCTKDDTDDTTVDGPDPATVPLGGVCDLAADYGGFAVISDAVDGGVQGSVADGVVPVRVLEEVTREGDCVLLRRNNPFCDPGCDAGQTCDHDGTCIPYPSNQDLGTVTVDGLAQAVSMDPVFPGNTYFDTSLPDPPFSPGQLITLDMPGGVYGPVTLYGVGFEPPELTDEEWQVEAGVDLIVRWSAPTGEVVRSEVAVSINIDQHGTSPTTLRCVFADDGEGTVPPGIVQALVDSGVTGFPSGSLERRTADKAAIAGGGCLDLLVSAPMGVAVDVAGFTPCVSQNDCPEPLDCNLELQICE